jgi:hypothetical protein
MRGLCGLNVGDGGRFDFQGGCAVCVWFFDGEFVVEGWWNVVIVVLNDAPRFLDLFWDVVA